MIKIIQDSYYILKKDYKKIIPFEENYKFMYD